MQHLDALASAQAIRLQRKAIREAITGEVATIAVALAAPSCSSAPIHKVLEWQPRWGPERAEQLLQRVAINPYRTAGELTERQRTLILDALA